MSAACAEIVNAFCLVVTFEATKPFYSQIAQLLVAIIIVLNLNALYNFIDWTCCYDEMK
jgi:TorA maturation chaperone TorD